MTFRVLFACCLLALAPLAGRVRAGAPVSAEAVASRYHSFEKITPTPVLGDPILLVRCTTLTPVEAEAETAKAGPHALALISIYMNSLAAHAFRAGDRYPEGSIIVKEKAVSQTHANPLFNADAATTGTGGMIKRAAGYDPSNGDWEYFYFSDPNRVEHGRIASCVECHARAGASDHVYGSWADAGTRQRAMSPAQH